MPNTYTPPVISVSFDMDEGEYVLMATSHGRAAIAGERIFRAEPWPQIKFKHTEEADAERDAASLRLYLNLYATGKLKDSANEPRRRAWWED